jgi:NAD(P)-dependent dehydrogenase (short-subunit alcohol dehydrogenase family)
MDWVRKNLFTPTPENRNDETQGKSGPGAWRHQGNRKSHRSGPAGRGIRVAATWHDWPESLAAMQSDFAGTGTDHLIERIDLLDTEAIPALVEQVMDRFGRLDILINNIERGGWPVVHGRYTREQWDLEMATTLRAKQWVFDAALPHLKASGDGAVVNISSIAGIVGRSGPASFCSTRGMRRPTAVFPCSRKPGPAWEPRMCASTS